MIEYKHIWPYSQKLLNPQGAIKIFSNFYNIGIMKKKFISLLIFLILISTAKSDWVNVTNGINNLNINALTATGNYIFAGNDQYIYRSSNNGNNWQQIYNLPSLSLAASGSIIFSGYQNGLLKSTNYGSNWGSGNLNQWTLCLLANSSNIYAGCFWAIPGGSTNRGVWLSTNYGANWNQTTLNYIDVYALAISGSYLFAAGYNTGVGSGIFVSTNNGQNWINPVQGVRYALASNENIIYGGTDGTPYGVYKSTNYGTNWIQTSLNNVGVHALAVFGNYVFAGASNGFYVSSDNGINWIQRNEGMTSGVRTLTIHDVYLFAGSLGQGIWRRPLSEITGININTHETPQNYELYQNYPNPFNPTTKIKYKIVNDSHIELKIYDILGRQIATLVNIKQNTGTYEVTFDAASHSSGVYFYKLISEGKVIDTKKMILSK